MKKLVVHTVCACFFIMSLFADNQTATVSPISSPEKLPFRVKIEFDFSLPNGLHSYAAASYKGKWVFLAGRTNGLHGFSNNDDNFPPQEQNTMVYVVDPHKKRTWSRSLHDSHSGLSQNQIDLLSVTSPQSYQKDSTLYMTGGYGVDTGTGLFSTKNVLTAIDIPEMIEWVMHPESHKKLSKNIRQLSKNAFRVTGGYMGQFGDKPTLLVFGQNFNGFYSDDSNGDYTQQVRRFRIHDNGKKLHAHIKANKPSRPNPNYRRRDLNIVPIIERKYGKLMPRLLALSGVFTLTDGVWTVPVKITTNGYASMENPAKEKTFKQGMNNYVCPTLSLFSKDANDMYVVLFGGISFGFFSNGQFQTDSEIPFINQVTTVRRNKHGEYKQYLMANQYPTILSTQSNPGNQLLFGAGANLMSTDVSSYHNGVIKLDEIKKKTVVGYIVGGIQSTVPNTGPITDSAASPYVFKVTIIPQ